jgi:hypothetical protein
VAQRFTAAITTVFSVALAAEVGGRACEDFFCTLQIALSAANVE